MDLHLGKGQLESRIGVLDVKSSLVQFNVLREGSLATGSQRVTFAKRKLSTSAMVLIGQIKYFGPLSPVLMSSLYRERKILLVGIIQLTALELASLFSLMGKVLAKL